MPTQLEHAPQATMESVFLDVHQKARRIAGVLEELRSAEHGKVSRETSIPGVGLSIATERGRVYGGCPQETSYVSAETGESTHRLFMVSSVFEVFRWFTTDVRGFRGDERGGDYSLSQTHPGASIQGELFQAGVVDERLTNEPFGYVNDAPSAKVADLPETDQQRLQIITHGILRGVSAAQLILDGGAVHDVLTVLGRPVEQTYE